MTQENVFSLRNILENKQLTLKELEELIPILNIMTKKIRGNVLSLNALASYQRGNKEKIKKIQTDVNNTIQRWKDHISRLGGYPQGLWKVEFLWDGKKLYWEFPNSYVTLEQGQVFPTKTNEHIN